MILFETARNEARFVFVLGSIGLGLDFEHEFGRDGVYFVEQTFVREDLELAESFDFLGDDTHEACAFLLGFAS